MELQWHWQQTVQCTNTAVQGSAHGTKRCKKSVAYSTMCWVGIPEEKISVTIMVILNTKA